jgi:integrase
MEKVIFKLKEPQSQLSKSKQKPTLVNMFFHFGYYEITQDGIRKYHPLKYSTGMKISPYYWKDNPHYRAKETKEFAHKNFNRRLDNIENAIIDIYRGLLNDNIKPTPGILRDELNKAFGKGLDVKRTTLIEFIRIIIDESKDGNRLTKKGKKISPITIKGYNTTLNHLLHYQETTSSDIDFDLVDMVFYKKFTSYFHQQNYSTNTIAKHIKNLKVFMKEAYKRDLTSNSSFQNEDFRIIEEESDQIYLNDNELEMIYNMPLSDHPRLERIRDLFIVASYTGLRFSDLKLIKPEHFINNETLLKIKTQKTDEIVVIPLHHTIKSILTKYEGKLPHVISNQKMNKHLKDMGRIAKINQTVSISITKGGLRVDKNYLKHELITVHTARRSFATNLYLAGVPTLTIMRITGHRTEKSFLKYIKVSPEENARLLAEHPYFKESHKLKIVK